MPPWRAFVINLNNDHDRWSFVQQQLVAAEVPYTRISGVDGEALKFPLAEVSERSLKYLHGRYPSKPEVGCYLSHIKAIEAFLDSDVTPKPGAVGGGRCVGGPATAGRLPMGCG